MQTLNNHPVHGLSNEENFWTSSLIPFCSFGEEFLGVKKERIDLPICDIFKARNFLDQICYETDLQEFKSSDSSILGKQLEMGLTLVLDYNEERQFSNFIPKNELSVMDQFYQNAVGSVTTHLDSISIKFKFLK